MTTTVENVSVRDIAREEGPDGPVSASVRWAVKNGGEDIGWVTIHVHMPDACDLPLHAIEQQAIARALEAVQASAGRDPEALYDDYRERLAAAS